MDRTVSEFCLAIGLDIRFLDTGTDYTGTD
jgi:hypothetical protein